MGIDPRLVPLTASDDAEAEIERLLIDVAGPLIRSIVAGSLRGGSCLPGDGADLESMIRLRLLNKFRSIVASPREAIEDVERYVATVSYNVINDYLRRRFPERTRHKNRLRYVLTHDRRLALWSTPAGLLCGWKKWEGAETSITFVAENATREMRDARRTADALHAIFEVAGAPLELEALVDLTAALWNIAIGAMEMELVDVHEAPPVQLERREFLRALWREIEQLLPMQRKALLLNLRDEETANVVALLVLTGAAQFDEVASALGMTGEELSDLWNDLPLDDLRIAARLQVTRQQVINLRKSARDRLRRRLRNHRSGWTS